MDAAALATMPHHYDDEETAWCTTCTAYLKTLLDEQGRAERGPRMPIVGPIHPGLSVKDTAQADALLDYKVRV